MPTRLICALVVVLCGVGCASNPAPADGIAAGAALAKRIVLGHPFRHVTYVAGGGTGPVWIYIEGDGIPWLNEYVPAADPSPRTLVALEAMTAGPRPALYAGRPCYFDTNADPGCSPLVWTHRRFAPEIVASMATALRSEIEAHGWTARRLVLVGFSGGGTLATLLAPLFDRVWALITIGSPLDNDEWTRLRSYSPLEGSINPASMPALSSRIRQLHLRGRDDKVVEAESGSAFSRRNPQAEFRVVDGNAHGREWVATWQKLTSESDFPGPQCTNEAHR